VQFLSDTLASGLVSRSWLDRPNSRGAGEITVQPVSRQQQRQIKDWLQTACKIAAGHRWQYAPDGWGAPERSRRPIRTGLLMRQSRVLTPCPRRACGPCDRASVPPLRLLKTKRLVGLDDAHASLIATSRHIRREAGDASEKPSPATSSAAARVFTVSAIA